MSESITLARLLLGSTDAEPADSGTISRDTVSGIAGTHGVQALLFSSPGCASELKQIEPLRRAALHQAAMFQLQDKELERVCTALYEADVSYMLIKGAALCYQIYPTPELRPRVDTDIFIDESSLTAVKETLSALGYDTIIAHDGGLVSYQTGMRFTDECGVVHTADIHWSLSNRHEYRDILDFEFVLRSSGQLPRFPFPVPAPNNVFALCLACLHLVGHHSHNPRLIWLYDMHLLMQQMDEREITEFIELTRETGLEDVTSQALTEMIRHFGSERIRNILTELGHGEGILLQGESRLALLKSNLRSFPTLRSKCQYLYAMAFPPIAYIEDQFKPGSKLLIPWYYVYRIFRGGFNTLASEENAPARDDATR